MNHKSRVAPNRVLGSINDLLIEHFPLISTRSDLGFNFLDLTSVHLRNASKYPHNGVFFSRWPKFHPDSIRRPAPRGFDDDYMRHLIRLVCKTSGSPSS